MLIGSGGYSKVWHPPRRNRLIDDKYRGNDDYVQRLTNESLTDISKGQFARTTFDKKNQMTSPLLAIYERSSKLYSEIRPFRDNDLSVLLSKNSDKNDLKLFCKILKNLKEIMKGLVVLHKKGWVHHDIKTKNILYNEKPFKLFLIDWGTSDRFSDVYSDENSPWFSGDNTNHPPEYKSYAHYKYGYQFNQGDFATDYANNIYIFSLLKIQSEYMSLLNKANTELQHEFKTKGERFLKQIAPKSDVFAIGMVLTQVYLLIAYATLYGSPFNKKMIFLIKNMIHPDPRKRWTMKKSVETLSPLVYQLCRLVL